MAIVSRSLDSLRSYLGSFTWGPFVKLSRSAVLGLLGRIEIGQLVVKDCDGTGTICGGAGENNGSPQTELKVLKEAFWVRVMLFADMVGSLKSIKARRAAADTEGLTERTNRASLRALCWARSHARISLLFSAYAGPRWLPA